MKQRAGRKRNHGYTCIHDPIQCVHRNKIKPRAEPGTQEYHGKAKFSFGKETAEMSGANGLRFNRRNMLKSSLAALVGGAIGQVAEAESRLKSLKFEDYRHALCRDREAGTEPVRIDSH